MVNPKRFSELSAQQQGLVRLCQAVHFGQILDVHVRGREPVFVPEPTVVRDVKLDAQDAPRPELELADFALRDEVCRLFGQIEILKNGRISRIDVQAGIPRRVVLEGKASDVRLWLRASNLRPANIAFGMTRLSVGEIER